MTLVIREYLPMLGRGVNVMLYGKAAKFYECLKDDGIIDKLRKVEQLGVISQIERSASHTRWEYVVLQLYLIQKLIREEKGALGKIRIGGKELSGVEVLQLWVFLFNMGHPPGTFATIRGLVSALNKDKELKEEIENKLLPNELKSKFEDVLRKRDIFNFPKFLSAIYLKKSQNCFIKLNYNLFIKLLLYYFKDIEKQLNEELKAEYEDNKDKIENLRSYFDMIRRLSFLSLDLKHVRFPINIDISEILSDPESYEELLEPYSQLNRTLEACEDLLSVTLYHSKNTITQMGIHSKKVEKVFKSSNTLIDWIEKPEPEFYPKFHEPLVVFHTLLDLGQNGSSLLEELKISFSTN